MEQRHLCKCGAKHTDDCRHIKVLGSGRVFSASHAALGIIELVRQHFLHCDTPLPCPPGTSPFGIKGEFYRNISGLLRGLDPEKQARLDLALDAQGITEFAKQRFLAGDFYDVLPMPRITTALAGLFDRDLMEFTTFVGESGAHMQMEGVYKVIFAGMNARTFSGRFSQVITYLYNFGPVTSKAHVDGVTLTRRNVPLCIAEWWNVISVPYVTIPLQHNGVKNVRVTCSTQESPAHASIPMSVITWEVRWDP